MSLLLFSTSSGSTDTDSLLINSEESFYGQELGKGFSVSFLINENEIPSFSFIKVAHGILLSISPISNFPESQRIPVGLGLSDFNLLLNDFKKGLSSTQELQTSLLNGNPFTGILNSRNSLGITGIQNLSSVLAGALKGIQIDKTVLSGDPIIGTEDFKNVLNIKDIITGMIVGKNTLKDTSSNLLMTDYDILVDDISIKDLLESCDVTISQSSVHNSIEFSSFDMGLYNICNPESNKGTSRITVQVDSRTLLFLIETRSGEEFNFKIWGRSLSALDDSPYAEQTTVQVPSPVNASELMLPYISLPYSWEADDWVLPIGISLTGTPVEILVSLAKQIGAIVRSDDSGNLHIRKKCKERPIDIDNSIYDVAYNRTDNLIQLSVEETLDTGYNKLHVFGYSGDVQVPDMELEEPCVLQGAPCHVRAYWNNGVLPVADPTVYLTDGTFTDEGYKTEFIENEIVEFRNGVASTAKPVTTLDPTDIAWIGADGGDISWSPYTKGLSIQHSAFRIATISYTTTYKRYNLHGHNVSKLMQVLALPPSVDISILLLQGVADKQAPDLKEDYLTSDYIATVAGTAWLDDNKYAKITMTAEAPYNDAAVDGVISNLEDGILYLSGNVYVTEASISFEGAKVVNKLGLVKCPA